MWHSQLKGGLIVSFDLLPFDALDSVFPCTFPCMDEISLKYGGWKNFTDAHLFLSLFVGCRGWLCYAFALLLTFFAVFLVITRCLCQGKTVDELKVITPPPMNAMEQLLAVQTAISQAEEVIQDGNIVLLKFRALLLSIFPQVCANFSSFLLWREQSY